MNDNLQEKSIEELLLELKPRERECLRYIYEGMKQGAAARAAGYKERSADVQASKLMQREISQIILKKMYERDCKMLCINKDSIVLRADDMYRKCMQATPVMEFNRETGAYEPTGEYQFDSRGAGKALEILCKVGGFEKAELEIKSKPAVINFVVSDGNEPNNQ